MRRVFVSIVIVFGLAPSCSAPVGAAEIKHDSEYYVLAAQHGERWATDDAVDSPSTVVRLAFLPTGSASTARRSIAPSAFWMSLAVVGRGAGADSCRSLPGFLPPAALRLPDIRTTAHTATTTIITPAKLIHTQLGTPRLARWIAFRAPGLKGE